MVTAIYRTPPSALVKPRAHRYYQEALDVVIRREAGLKRRHPSIVATTPRKSGSFDNPNSEIVVYSNKPRELKDSPEVRNGLDGYPVVVARVGDRIAMITPKSSVESLGPKVEQIESCPKVVVVQSGRVAEGRAYRIDGCDRVVRVSIKKDAFSGGPACFYNDQPPEPIHIYEA